MPLISHIGRRSPKVRALIACIYVVLILGSATMVYPFLIMVAGSTRSGVDLKDFDPWPDFLTDDVVLYRKHIEGLLNESTETMRVTYGIDVPTFDQLDPPQYPNTKFVAEWRAFLEETAPPEYAYACGYVKTPVSYTVPLALREFRNELMARFGRDIEAFNRSFETDFVAWYAVAVLPREYLDRRFKPGGSKFDQAFREYKKRAPRWNRYYFSPEGFYKTLFLKAQYSRDIDEYNQAHGTQYKSYDEIHLTRHAPNGTPLERQDWEDYVRHSLNVLWIRADATAQPIYAEFLQAKYRDIDALNRNYGTQYRAFDEIPLIEEPPASGLPSSDWESFINGWEDPDTNAIYMIPTEMVRVHSVEFMFRDYLEKEYGAIERVNAACGTDFSAFGGILPPRHDDHYLAFLNMRRELRWEFVTRNYRAVLGFLVFHGRGVINTVIYCSLSVLFALLVNPLAAYAMSRFQMPSTYKILLFLMLTMAFPPMVTSIPVFLMLRELHLLNTFAALVLPGLANGYSIFLLKGFFDSLPRDLYESAAIDGASEWTIFWSITMSLSKPILAVIALGAFTAAYSNFMFALLICQDDKMWTLMVWLFQLGRWAGPGVKYASLIIAAIPTFAIFVFCQKIIMRGIVVPVEK